MGIFESSFVMLFNYLKKHCFLGPSRLKHCSRCFWAREGCHCKFFQQQLNMTKASAAIIFFRKYEDRSLIFLDLNSPHKKCLIFLYFFLEEVETGHATGLDIKGVVNETTNLPQNDPRTSLLVFVDKQL